MRKWWALVSVLLAIIVVGVLGLIFIPVPGKKPATPAPGNIVVDLPAPNTKVTSPLLLSGKALGSWYFEGTAPATLLDSNGSVIAQGAITAKGDWTNPGYVTFSGSIDFPLQPSGTAGTLVLTNDNPSGNPANQKTVDIPVKF